MANWKLYTPDGTAELLPDQCADKTLVENSICEVFEDFGYKVIETPVMQFYDAYTTNSGTIPQETMYKFFDRDGRILVLRPDITTCVARMAAGKLFDGVLPKRLYYSGKVFRYQDRQYDVICEFCQAGIELIGIKNDKADAEVISCAIESLIASGLENFQIELGQVEFFKGLTSSLSDEVAEKIRALIDKKDSFAIDQFLKTIDIDENIKKLISKLPSMFGDIEILDSIDLKSLPEQSQAAVLNLKNVYSILKDYGLDNYVSIDLSLVQGINCYTGIIFKGITHGIGYSICQGGRYDGLCGEFGNDLPAVGMAIETDKLLSVLSRGDFEVNKHPSDLVLYCSDNALKYRVLKALRNEGYTVEDYIGDDSCEDAEKYAEQIGVQGFAFVYENHDILSIHNFAENITEEIELSDFLENDDCHNHDTDCDCGCHHH